MWLNCCVYCSSWWSMSAILFQILIYACGCTFFSMSFLSSVDLKTRNNKAGLVPQLDHSIHFLFPSNAFGLTSSFTVLSCSSLRTDLTEEGSRRRVPSKSSAKCYQQWEGGSWGEALAPSLFVKHLPPPYFSFFPCHGQMLLPAYFRLTGRAVSGGVV